MIAVLKTDKFPVVYHRTTRPGKGFSIVFVSCVALHLSSICINRASCFAVGEIVVVVKFGGENFINFSVVYKCVHSKW